MQWNRTRRCWLLTLRKPQPLLLTCLTSRFSPSVRALVMPVWMNAKIDGHQVSTVVASVVSSGMSERAHQS